jgi:DNA-binding NarL/FixJ family response regulator
MKRITILLVEDHAIVREGLRGILKLVDEVDVIGEAATGQEAVDMAKRLLPRIVLMDIAMPILNGFEATRQILQTAPDTRIIVLTAYSDEVYVKHMLEIGISGYILKQNSSKSLRKAIRKVAAGGTYFCESIKKRLDCNRQKERERGVSNKLDSSNKNVRKLTVREAEVWQLVAEGSTNKQIAAQLGISIKTVEKHRQQLMDKLNIHETAGLTRYAIAMGVIENRTQRTTAESS